MLYLTIAGLTFALLFWYVLYGRPWLKTRPWAAAFFAWVEPVEIVLYKKSETILLARAKMATGVLLTVLTYLGTIDVSPIMPLVPDEYEGYLRAAFNLLPLVLSLIGLADERLRNQTTLPIEIVAVADKNITPKVAEAIAMVDATKTEAVAVIAEAKTNGNH